MVVELIIETVYQLAHIVMQCLSVCVCVCHIRGLCQNKYTYLQNFLTVG